MENPNPPAGRRTPARPSSVQWLLISLLLRLVLRRNRQETAEILNLCMKQIQASQLEDSMVEDVVELWRKQSGDMMEENTGGAVESNDVQMMV